MSERNRGNDDPNIAFAVFCLLFIFGLIGWQEGFKRGTESHESHSAEAYQDEHPDKVAIRCRALVGNSAQSDCISKAIKSAREQQRAEQDLDAQQQMAEWARYMLYATAITAVFTLFGVIYVARTLNATEKTLYAANRLNEITLAEQRPWIKIRISQDVRIVRDGKTFISYRIEAKNVGKTPAYDVSISSKLALVFDLYEMQDAENLNREIWNFSDSNRTFKRNRAGSAMLPGSQQFQFCEDELDAAKAAQLHKARIAIALKAEYFTPVSRAEFRQSGVMFELLNPQDMRFTCELFDLADVQGETVVWQHQGSSTYMT